MSPQISCPDAAGTTAEPPAELLDADVGLTRPGPIYCRRALSGYRAQLNPATTTTST